MDTFLLKVSAIDVEHIDGGGWIPKRYVPGTGYDKWHPSTDLLVGTDVYGLKGCTTQPWSEEFKSSNFDQFLFISGDKKMWMMMTRLEAIGTNAAPAWYDNETRTIVMSSKQDGSYTAQMWRRSGVA